MCQYKIRCGDKCQPSEPYTWERYAWERYAWESYAWERGRPRPQKPEMQTFPIPIRPEIGEIRDEIGDRHLCEIGEIGDRHYLFESINS